MRKYAETDRRILKLLIPVILENALLTLSTMILTGYIGRLPVMDISAYGIGRRIYGIYYSFFKGLAVGTMVAAARRFGRGDTQKCARIQQESYLMIIPAAVFLSVLIVIFALPILSLMTKDAALLERGVLFLRKTAPFYPLLAVIHLNAAAFQANGNTRTPMMIAGIGNLITITIGYVLIFGLGPIKGMGVAGAAWGQNLAFLVMASVGLFLLYGKHGLFAQSGTRLFRLPAKTDIREIFATGIPASFEDSFWQLATVVIRSVILSYGQEYYAAYQLGLEGEGFCNMMSAGFMTAAMSLSANALGAEDQKAFRICFDRLHHFCLIISAITMLFLLFFSRPVLHLLTDKPELIVIASSYLFAMIFSQYPQHMKQIAAGYLRASGHTQTSMITNLIGLWVVRVPLVLLCGSVLKLDIIFVWWAFNLDQWVRLTLSVLSLRRFHILPPREITNEMAAG